MNLATHKSIAIGTCACLAMCIGFGLPWYAAAADRTSANGDGLIKRVADDESDSDATQQTLNLNFSPEDRVRLRQALDDYARSVDPDHEQIEERRRAMQESMEERFLAIDKDNDGSIDRQEATEGLPQVARHFSQVDTNQDEKITLDELEEAQARIIERRKTAEAALQAQKLQAAEAIAKRKSKQATNARKQRAL